MDLSHSLDGLLNGAKTGLEGAVSDKFGGFLPIAAVELDFRAMFPYFAALAIGLYAAYRLYVSAHTPKPEESLSKLPETKG